jgi:hypothetical protein
MQGKIFGIKLWDHLIIEPCSGNRNILGETGTPPRENQELM